MIATIGLALLLCIAWLIVSPVADLPVTALKTLHAGLPAVSPVAHISPLVAPLSPQSGEEVLIPDRDVLSLTVAYRC